MVILQSRQQVCGRGMRQACYDFADAYTKAGGNCTVVDLPKEGITGNDHFMFQDLNNDVIQEHIENWIQEKCRSISKGEDKNESKKK